MRKPSWETSPGALADLLNTSQQHVRADLYTFTLRSGVTLRYTSAASAVTINGRTWIAGPLIERNRTRSIVGIEVDTLDMTLRADETVAINGVPLIAFIRRGGLQGARVLLERMYAADWYAAVAGTVVRFSGRVGPMEATRYSVRLNVKSDLELLDVAVPRNVYQPSCMNTLYDAACGINRNALTVVGAVTTQQADNRALLDINLAHASGYFDLGVVTFLSGPNAGISRTIKRHTPGRFELIAPVPYALTAGVTLSAYPGCDRRQSTCQNRFNNIVAFRGTPYVPVAETVT